MQVTITPQYIDAPKPGKKNWSIKDTAGAYYSFPPDLAVGLQAGQPVTIDYRTNNFNNKTFNMVERVYGASAPPAQTQAAPSTPSHPHAPLPTPAASATQPQPHRNGDAKAREMFIMGVVGRAMGGGNFQVTDIKLLTLAAADAWDELARRDQGGDAPF